MGNVSLVDGHIEEPKMTDEEIIKALECCAEYRYVCDSPLCPIGQYSNCRDILRKNTLDMVKRKDAEIERLKKILENRGEICKLCEGKYTEKIKHAKAKAIKEFAERLKERHCGNTYPYVLLGDIDNLVKEMVEDKVKE